MYHAYGVVYGMEVYVGRGIAFQDMVCTNRSLEMITKYLCTDYHLSECAYIKAKRPGGFLARRRD